VKVADRFLSKGVIVTTESRGKPPEVEQAHEKDTEPGYAIVLLVNRGSASASEIVAGALQDHGRAVVAGVRTFGKGSVQTIVELDDGSALKLTVARYFTPNHRSIQERGIAPDVLVEASDQPTGSIETPQSGRGPRRSLPDPQLDRAIDLLRVARIFRGPGPVAP
jgi:carboxyl-terminal processing protease